MIAIWMLLATLVAALLGIAAAAAEAVARTWGRPARAAWTMALALSVVLPLAAPLLAARGRAPSHPRGAPAAAANAAPAPYRLPTLVVRAGDAMQSRVVRLSPLDRPLALLWLLGSAGVLALLVRGARDLARARRGWRAESVDGVPVLLADDTGPAVVGVRRPAIVLPAWALDLDAPLRALVLRHETEHRDARDPLWLALGALGVALAPWNLALWWQLRQLRIAVEIDCDARVLAAHRDVSRYGLLLLAVAQRRAASSWRLAGAPALAESSSDLSRRITAMRTPTPRRRALRTTLALALGIPALAGAFAACSASRDVTSPRGVAPVDGRLATLVSDDSSRIVVGGRTYQLVAGTPTMPHVREIDGVRVDAAGPSLVAGKPIDTAAVRRIRERNAATRPALRPAVQDGPYFEFQVEQPVAPLGANRGPRYPDMLKTANVEGIVMAQFVVDTTGHVVPSTFKVLKSDHDLFTQAVRTALDSMQYSPALVGGRKVKQLVQQPFQFSLTP